MTADRDRFVENLERLSELHRSGVLNDAEFTAAKQRLLGQDVASSNDASTTEGSSASGTDSTPSREVGQDGNPVGLPPPTPHPSLLRRAESIVGRLRRRPRGALVTSVAVAVVLVGAVGWAVSSSGGPVADACRQLRTANSGEVGQVLSQGRFADGEMTAIEFRDAVEERCPSVLDEARERRQRRPASNQPAPAPPASPAPAPPAAPSAPSESIEQRRAREVQECIARGPDYRWTAANQCVFDPAPPPITQFGG